MRFPYIALTAALTLSFTEASAAPYRLPKDSQEKLGTIIKDGAKSQDLETRALATAALPFLPRKNAVALVTDALGDPQWTVKKEAIEGLRILKDRRWDKEIQNSICSTSLSPELAVLPLMKDLGPKKAAPVLLKAFESKGCESAFSRYIPALDQWAKSGQARAEGEEWLTELFRLALRSRNASTLASVQAELPKLPLNALLPLLKGLPGLPKLSPELQAQILPKLKGQDLGNIGFLKPLLNSKAPGIAFQAALLLAENEDNSGRKILVFSASGKDASERVEALNALKSIPDAHIYQLAKDRIKEEGITYDELVAAYELYALSKPPKLPSYLDKQADATDLTQRSAAIRMLGQVKGEAALSQLHPLLGPGPQQLRLAAISSLLDIGNEASIPVLGRSLAAEQDPSVRLAILKALKDFPSPQSINVARFYITENDEDMRRAAVSVITNHPVQDAVSDLKIVMRDRLHELRFLALDALLKIDAKAHFSFFESSLSWIEPLGLQSLLQSHPALRAKMLSLSIEGKTSKLRATALGQLALLNASERDSLLESLLASKELALQNAALDHLPLMSKEKAQSALQTLAEGENTAPSLKARALSLYPRYEVSENAEALIPFLSNPSPLIRTAAALGISRF